MRTSIESSFLKFREVYENTKYERLARERSSCDVSKSANSREDPGIKFKI